MMRHIKQIGSKVIKIGFEIAWWARLLWYLGFLAFAAILVIDLFRIPVYSVNNSDQYAPEKQLWEKKDPTDPKVIAEEKKLKELQEHCPHIYKYNGLYHYYCPICRKKLTKAKPPIWSLG